MSIVQLVSDAGFQSVVRDPDAGAGAAAATMRQKRNERQVPNLHTFHVTVAC